VSGYLRRVVSRTVPRPQSLLLRPTPTPQWRNPTTAIDPNGDQGRGEMFGTDSFALPPTTRNSQGTTARSEPETMMTPPSGALPRFPTDHDRNWPGRIADDDRDSRSQTGSLRPTPTVVESPPSGTPEGPTGGRARRSIHEPNRIEPEREIPVTPSSLSARNTVIVASPQPVKAGSLRGSSAEGVAATARLEAAAVSPPQLIPRQQRPPEQKRPTPMLNALSGTVPASVAPRTPDITIGRISVVVETQRPQAPVVVRPQTQNGSRATNTPRSGSNGTGFHRFGIGQL
jgi:hypothetical protein